MYGCAVCFLAAIAVPTPKFPHNPNIPFINRFAGALPPHPRLAAESSGAGGGLTAFPAPLT